ncbi:MAG: DUF6880 family protein [Geminicoccaceae bacterium]
MVSKKALNPANLEALGARRLAEILLELGTGDAGIKRRLRLELAAEAGAEAVAADLGKRLTTLRQARSFVDWQKRRAFVKDLELQRASITEKVADTRPDLALELMWRFLGLAEPVLNRVDDSRGDVGDVFRQACLDLGAIAARAAPDPVRLADRVFEAVTGNGYGEYDRLVEVILPALQGTGVARLKQRLTAALAERPRNKGSFDSRAGALRCALQDIADSEGDIDTFIAHVTDRRSPHGAAAIASRLLAVGRAEEALGFLEQGAPNEPAARQVEDEWALALEGTATSSWEQSWVDALVATDRLDEAQQFRWAKFKARLDAGHLRAYLKALPDFEDVEAERKALDHALGFPHVAVALSFLVDWPELRYAARLVLERSQELDGNLYFLLDPAAKALEGKQPLAAVLLRRAMIEDTLDGAKSTRYRHAARHLLECRTLEPAISDHGRFESHHAFVARLQEQHGRKTGFWGQVGR